MSKPSLEERMLDLLYGDLDPDAAAALEAEVKTDPVLRERLEAWRQVRHAMAELPEPEPDPQVRYAILRAARQAVEAPEKKGIFAWLAALSLHPAFAALGLAVVGGGLWLALSQGYRDSEAPPESRLEKVAAGPREPTMTTRAEAPQRAPATEAAEGAAAAPQRAPATEAAEEKAALAIEAAPPAPEPVAAESIAAEPAAEEAEEAAAPALDRAPPKTVALEPVADGESLTRAPRAKDAKARWADADPPAARRKAEARPEQARARGALEDSVDEGGVAGEARGFGGGRGVDTGFAPPPPAPQTAENIEKKSKAPAPFPAEQPPARPQSAVEDAPAVAAAPEAPIAAPREPEPDAFAQDEVVRAAPGDAPADADDTPTGALGGLAERERAANTPGRAVGAGPPRPEGTAKGVPVAVRATRDDARTEGPPPELLEARSARRRGDHEAAVDAYQRYRASYQGDDQFGDALLEAAQSYEALGDTPRALQLYRLAARSGDAQVARQARERIGALEALQKSKVDFAPSEVEPAQPAEPAEPAEPQE